MDGEQSSRNETPSDDKFSRNAPQISLPKGGGAIRGIGEKFAANPVTGTGSMFVPVFTSPARSGFDPQLSLSYDSGAGNGPFGLGWSLSLPTITKKTDKGLRTGDRELLGSYHSAEAAADDVYTQHTGWHEWDVPGRNNAPRDLGEWEIR